MPWTSSSSPISSSASAAPIASCGVAAAGARERLLLQRAPARAASSRSTPASTKVAITVLIESSASPSACADRFAAAAGLLSSCASPADIWPSAASFSRWDSIAEKRLSTGRNVRMTRWKATGVANSSAAEALGGRPAPIRLGSVARMVTIDSSPVSVLIAPSQVGAWW